MVVDTSSMVAILFGEPDADRFEATIAAAEFSVTGAVSMVELTIVALSRRGFTIAEIEKRLHAWGIEIVPVTTSQARLAAAAFARYGKGRHPAGLNFGDCFAYALAKERREPLLFKGDDFARTDIEAA